MTISTKCSGPYSYTFKKKIFVCGIFEGVKVISARFPLHAVAGFAAAERTVVAPIG